MLRLAALPLLFLVAGCVAAPQSGGPAAPPFIKLAEPTKTSPTKGGDRVPLMDTTISNGPKRAIDIKKIPVATVEQPKPHQPTAEINGAITTLLPQNTTPPAKPAITNQIISDPAFIIAATKPGNDPLPTTPIPQPFTAVNTSVIELLHELSTQQGISLSAQSSIQPANITIQLKQMPLGQAINAITQAADVNFSFKNGQLNIQQNTHYTLTLPPATPRAFQRGESYTSRDEPFYNELSKTLEGFGASSIRTDIQARSLTYAAAPKAAAAITAYIDQLRRNRVRIVYQVWIAEVAKQSETGDGIRWDELRATIGDADINLTGGNAVTQGYTLTTNLVTSALNIASVVQFLETQGTVQVLSNPQISLISGSTVQLDDTETRPYLALAPIAPASDATDTANITTGIDTRELITGVALELTGDFQGGLVTTNLHLDISDFLGFEQFTAGGAAAQLPRSTSRKITTQISAPPGNIVVLGGITRSSETANNSKIPGLGQLFPSIFGSDTKKQRTSQLVIALLPRIVRFVEAEK